MNTIHIELPGIEAKLDRIIELLEKQTTHNCESGVNTATQYVAQALRQNAQERTEGTGGVNTQPEEETPTEATEANDAHPVTDDLPWTEAPAPEQPTVTREDVQKLVVTLSAAGKKAAVKAVVQHYAKNVSGLPEDKLAEVVDKLKVVANTHKDKLAEMLNSMFALEG